MVKYSLSHRYVCSMKYCGLNVGIYIFERKFPSVALHPSCFAVLTIYQVIASDMAVKTFLVERIYDFSASTQTWCRRMQDKLHFFYGQKLLWFSTTIINVHFSAVIAQRISVYTIITDSFVRFTQMFTGFIMDHCWRCLYVPLLLLGRPSARIGSQ